MTYQGKRIDIVPCERGYYWIVWHREGIPLCTAYSFRTEDQARADARRYIDRTYDREEQQA
jgi:hypothetical protein